MRSRLWFVVAGVIAIAGIAGAVSYLLPRLGGISARLTQFMVPGSATINLAEAGTYTIYHEDRSLVDGEYYSSRAVDGLVVRVQSPSGRDVPVARTATTSSYSFGDRGGTSILEFTIDTPGAYRFTGTLRGRNQPRVVLAVGKGVVGAIFEMVGVTLVIVFGSLGVAGAILAIVLIQRRKAPAAASNVPLGHGGPGT